jgi:hypothetical protein
MQNPPIPPNPSHRDPLPPSDEGRKKTALTLASIVGIALLALVVVAIFHERSETMTPDQIAFADKPSQGRIDQCNQYAAQVARDSGAIGGSPSVRDDDPNLVGLSDENRYSDAARVAYRDCMIGIQHES